MSGLVIGSIKNVKSINNQYAWAISICETGKGLRRCSHNCDSSCMVGGSTHIWVTNSFVSRRSKPIFHPWNSRCLCRVLCLVDSDFKFVTPRGQHQQRCRTLADLAVSSLWADCPCGHCCCKYRTPSHGTSSRNATLYFCIRPGMANVHFENLDNSSHAALCSKRVIHQFMHSSRA